MLKSLLIKIFIFIFILTSILTFIPSHIGLADFQKIYIVPIRLSTFSNLNNSLPKSFSLVKTAIIKENNQGSSITISFETKDTTKESNYILDVNIYENSQLKKGEFFYRFFDEKSKNYIHQVQFERQSKKEDQLKLNIVSNNKEKSNSDVVIQLDWNKAKDLNTKKFSKTNLFSTPTTNHSTIFTETTSTSNIKSNQKPINPPSSSNNSTNISTSIMDTTIDKPLSNPARMQDYINYYNNLKNNSQVPSPIVSTSQVHTSKIEELPEDILNEDKDKKTHLPILRSISDFFSSDNFTKSEGSYVTDISSNHLNPLTAKLADENSNDENIIKILSRNIITPSIESTGNLKEILRQEVDVNDKKWARAGLERKDDKLYATVRLHLLNHITRSQEEGPFFKVLQENGQYELVPASESHLNINKDGDSYADYTFEVPKENFSAMVQVNVEPLNKTINFFLETNPRSIKKGTITNIDSPKTQPASPLVKTILLGSIIFIVLSIPLLAVKRLRQLEEYEYEDYDDEEDY